MDSRKGGAAGKVVTSDSDGDGGDGDDNDNGGYDTTATTIAKTKLRQPCLGSVILQFLS